VADPASDTGNSFQVDAQRVEYFIDNPQVGFAYTIAVTINVASTVPGTNIDYLPEIQVQGQQQTAASTEPVVGSSLERVTAGPPGSGRPKANMSGRGTMCLASRESEGARGPMPHFAVSPTNPPMP